jgi:methionine-rich copper-binding protein CopC
MRLIAAAGFSVAAISICAVLSPVFAEALLVESNPASGSAIAAPRLVKLTFSEKILPASSGFQLSMGDGMAVSTTASLSDDGTTLIGRPTSPFMAGKWTLSWHVTAAGNGKRSQGSYSFTVK